MNKSIGLIFAIFVALAVSYAFSARHGAPLPATEITVNNALLLDTQRAGQRLVAVGERGYIFVSDNEGAAWRRVPSGIESTLNAVAFADLLGIAVGHDAAILRSEDGGLTWKAVFSAPDQLRPLLDVTFVSPQHVLAVGAYGAFFESTDGGLNWNERQIVDGDRHFNALARLADGTLMIAGEAGTLLRSNDGGANWEVLPPAYAGSYFGIQPLAQGGVLVYGMRGTVLRSDDRGDSWQTLASEGAGSLFGSTMTTDGSVVLVGQNGTVLGSRDGGTSFKRLPVQGSRLWMAAVAAPVAGEAMIFGEGAFARIDAAEGEKQ
ncbi:hypothetical protein BJN45_14440 [Azonexus hydrophilus]|uniref:Photosynthesis system II assembly factor Ycf48/Hcf136-like domain-containing protein n=1 Tax=Azonexus hydrophilus TaxID=418702 RepID=A0A1R1I155_9RHOO|nr:YCF48-related protein [Azonexus hydrophilus]OMG52492.1 hypothetical protein BJN45_14440 [Azonexus hydrophilus]